MIIKTFYDATNKKLTSFRDGVQEYFGAEIGVEPAGKIFTVFRSPESVNEASELMPELTITDEHVPLDSEAKAVSIGTVLDSEVVEMTDESTDTTVAVQNKVTIGGELLTILSEGRRELSLGYNAKLEPHAGEYDFVQTNIKPHHLAVVDSGRCGSVCSFNDKEKQMPAAEEEKKVSIQGMDELLKSLPDAIKSMPLDDVKALADVIDGFLKDKGNKEEVEDTDEKDKEEVESKDADKEEDKKEVESKDADKDEDEKKQDAKDADKDEDKKQKGLKDSKCACQSGFNDSSEFKDAVKSAVESAVKQHVVVVEKARDFLADDYGFADKAVDKIMRDAIATQTDEQFQDAEVETAFKMLKQSSSDYSNFGDSTASSWANLNDKDL